MTEAEKLEAEIMERALKLAALRKAERPTEIPDYEFQSLDGPVNLSALFAGRDRLLVIHNMGQGCRYCTLWADGFNGALDHLEDAAAVVMVSKDAPDVQRAFAQSRGWRFRMASHGGGAYMTEQSVMDGNYPGAVFYERDGDKILRRGKAVFGPGDIYCPVWGLLALGGLDEADWTPQYRYWSRPQQMDDGGENIRD